MLRLAEAVAESDLIITAGGSLDAQTLEGKGPLGVVERRWLKSLAATPFYLTIRLRKSNWWLLPGVALLAVFAWLLTLNPIEGAGRVYAAYGGIYIAASLLWLCFIEKQTPDRWDLIGSLLCLAGAFVIYFGPR